MPKTIKSIIYIIIGLFVLYFIYLVKGILLPFILSALLAYVVSPIIGYFESFGIKRSIVILTLYTGCLIVFVGSLMLVIPALIKEVSLMSEKMPEYTILAKTTIVQLQNKLEAEFPIIAKKGLIDAGLQKGQLFVNQALEKIPDYLMSSFSLFTLLVLIPFITYFILADGKSVFDKLFRMVPSRYVERVLSFICEFDVAVGSFIRLQFIEASLVGLLSIIGLLILGVNYAVFIGLFAGLANMVPYLGPVAGAIPAIIVSLMQFGTPDIILKIVILFAIIQFIDNNFIQPFLMSQGTSLHPAVVIFAVMAGAEVAGVFGMFFAVPIASIIKATVTIVMKRPGSN